MLPFSRDQNQPIGIKLPGHWIKMVHRARTDTVHPDIELSPIQGALGDCLMANRHTYFVKSPF